MLYSKLLLILTFILANVSMTSVSFAKSERRQNEISRSQKSPEVQKESEEEEEEEEEEEDESRQGRKSSRQVQNQRPEKSQRNGGNSQANSARRECLQDVHAEAMALFQKVRTACRGAKSGAADMAACDTARAEIETSIQSFRTKIQACLSQNQPAPVPQPMPAPMPQQPAPAPQPMPAPQPNPVPPVPRPTPMPMPVPKPPTPAPQPMPAPMPQQPAPQPMPAPVPVPVPTPNLDGAALYEKNCSSCHDSLADSERKGRSAAQITSALKNVSAMKNRANLMALTPAEVSAIATALGGKP